MKSYTETERQEHVENWKNGTLSKSGYAKSAGIFPTTFYHWTNKKSKVKNQDFVELNNIVIPETGGDIVIEKGTMTIRIPLSVGSKELQSVFAALEGTQ